MTRQRLLGPKDPGSAGLGHGLGELAVVQLVVEAVAAQQVMVAALFDDAAVVHDHDGVAPTPVDTRDAQYLVVAIGTLTREQFRGYEPGR
jgi:hypothetical protein